MKKYRVNFILSARVSLIVSAEDAEDAFEAVRGDIPHIEYSEAEDTEVCSWVADEIDVLDQEENKLDPISYNHISKFPKEPE